MSTHGMIKIDNVSKQYGRVNAVRNVNLEIEDGTLAAVVGPSGAGKTTLLRCMKGLTIPTSGRILVDGVRVDINNRDLTRSIGWIPQQLDLVKRMSALTSVLCGRLGYVDTFRSMLGLFSMEDKMIALDSLAAVGLRDKTYSRVDMLSGGEQQRVAVARVLAQSPKVILADEPVASLDHRNAVKVIEIISEACKKRGITAVISLHNLSIAEQYADRIVVIQNGMVAYDVKVGEISRQELAHVMGVTDVSHIDKE